MKEEITEFTLDMIGDFIQSKAESVPNEMVDLSCDQNWVTAQMAKQLFSEYRFISSGFFTVKFKNNQIIDIHEQFINFADYVERDKGVGITWELLNEQFKEWSSNMECNNQTKPIINK